MPSHLFCNHEPKLPHPYCYGFGVGVVVGKAAREGKPYSRLHLPNNVVETIAVLNRSGGPAERNLFLKLSTLYEEEISRSDISIATPANSSRPQLNLPKLEYYPTTRYHASSKPPPDGASTLLGCVVRRMADAPGH